MPPIPRSPLAEPNTRIASVDLGDLLAPYRAGAELAKTATEAIQKPALEVFDKLVSEEKRTRQLAFQAVLAKKRADMHDTIVDHTERLAAMGKSDEIRNFFHGQADQLIAQHISDINDPMEKQEAATVLTHDMTGEHQQAYSKAIQANIQMANQGVENKYHDLRAAVENGQLHISDALAQAGDLKKWSVDNQIASEPAAEMRNRAAIQDIGHGYLQGTLGEAAAVFTKDPWYAIKYLKDALEIVPGELKDSGLDGVAKEELSRRIEQYEFYTRQQSKKADDTFYSNIKERIQRGETVAPDSDLPITPDEFNRLNPKQRGEIKTDLVKTWPQAYEKAHIADWTKNAIHGMDKKGNPLSGPAFINQTAPGAADAAKSEFAAIDGGRNDVESATELAQAKKNLGWAPADFVQPHIANQLSSGDANQLLAALTYYKQTSNDGTKNVKSGLDQFQLSALKNLNDILPAYTTPLDPNDPNPKQTHDAQVLKAWQDASAGLTLKEDKTDQMVRNRFGAVNQRDSVLDKYVAKTTQDTFKSYAESMGIPQDKIDAAWTRNSSLYDSHTRYNFAHHGSGTSIRDRRAEIDAASKLSSSNLSDDWGFDQNDNFVYGTPLTVARTKEARDIVKADIAETAKAYGSSPDSFGFQPAGTDTHGNPRWIMYQVTPRGISIISDTYYTAPTGLPAERKTIIDRGIEKVKEMFK